MLGSGTQLTTWNINEGVWYTCDDNLEMSLSVSTTFVDRYSIALERIGALFLKARWFKDLIYLMIKKFNKLFILWPWLRWEALEMRVHFARNQHKWT